MDEQLALDNETKALRYDRLVRAQGRLEAAKEQVVKLTAQLRLAKNELREAVWDRDLAMSPVRKGVRG